MLILFRPAAVATLASTFVIICSLRQSALSQASIGPPPSVIRGNPETPVLVPDPQVRFEEQMMIMKNNQSDLTFGGPDEKTCFLSPLTGVRAATVGVGSLASHTRASQEYGKACGAIAEKKFESAEKHLRKVIEQFPEYPDAWVLLGQVLERREQAPQARESCLHAAIINAKFVPAYLCLADIAAQSRDWNEVLKQSDRALALDPASNAVTYVFIAGANFNLRHFTEAEKCALRASQVPGGDVDPRYLHYLLAEIYEAKGDLANEIAQLREFVKAAGDRKETEIVKRYLAKLGNAPNKDPEPGTPAAAPEHEAK
jgi:hypothetical protein